MRIRNEPYGSCQIPAFRIPPVEPIRRGAAALSLIPASRAAKRRGPVRTRSFLRCILKIARTVFPRRALRGEGVVGQK